MSWKHIDTQAPFQPSGDQPQAIEKLIAGINAVTAVVVRWLLPILPTPIFEKFLHFLCGKVVHIGSTLAKPRFSHVLCFIFIPIGINKFIQIVIQTRDTGQVCLKSSTSLHGFLNFLLTVKETPITLHSTQVRVP